MLQNFVYMNIDNRSFTNHNNRIHYALLCLAAVRISLEMMSLCIWEVPSYIWYILASRISFSTGYSVLKPFPPNIWTASAADLFATSDAKHLATDAKTVFFWPEIIDVNINM